MYFDLISNTRFDVLVLLQLIQVKALFYSLIWCHAVKTLVMLHYARQGDFT